MPHNKHISSPSNIPRDPNANILESSSAWLVGFALSPAEYKRIYNIVSRNKNSSGSFETQLDEALTKYKRTNSQAKGLAHILFPRPEVVAFNNIESNPAHKKLGTLENRCDTSEFSAAAELYTKPSETVKPAIRSHLRLCFKAYVFIVLAKSLKRLHSSKKGTPLKPILVLKDRVGAQASLSLAAIAFSYKLVYGALVLCKPVFKEFLATFIHDQSLLSDILYGNAHALIPLVSGITAGSFLKLYPNKNAGRDLISVYAMVRSLEFVYNYLDDKGYLLTIRKPKLIGSWALFPFAYAQLFHAFFFDRTANPPFVNSALFSLSSNFFPLPPSGYPKKAQVPWPKPAQVVDAIAAISKAHYPKFTPTLLFPDSAVVPAYLDPVKPIIIRAHPAISTLTGALIHPWEPSQLKAILRIIVQKYMSIGKYAFLFYLIKTFMIKNIVRSVEPDTESHQAAVAAAEEAHNKRASRRSNKHSVGHDNYYEKEHITDATMDASSKSNKIQKLLAYSRLLLAACFNTWRTTTFLVMTTVFSWAGIEFWQSVVGRSVMPVYRYKIIGFLSGLWAIFDKVSGRGRYMYAVRAAVLSSWRVLVNEKKVKPVKNGDVYIFAVALGVTMSIMEMSPASVAGPAMRKALTWVSEGTFKDPIEKRQRKILKAMSKKDK